MTGHIILCADDYALAPGVSRAIRMLAAAGRISATSAIVTQPHWLREASALRPLLADVAVGLHLNLTLGAPLTSGNNLARRGRFRGIGKLMALAFFRRLKPAGITAEIERQLDAFEAGMGRAPDFVDGHEHVHVLPEIRQALLVTLKRRYAGKPILIRDPSPLLKHVFAPHAPLMKSLLLRRLARDMRRDVVASGFISNGSFAGLSAFAPTVAAVERDFSNAADLEGWRPIFMCHPGFPDADLARVDAITKRRQIEFDALMRASPVIQNIWRPQRNSDGGIAWPASAMERSV